MHIGDRVKRLRRAKNMTQAQLVAAVKKRGGDLSQPQLSAIEKGDVEHPSSLLQLADEFAVFPSWLLTGLGMQDRSDPMSDFKGPDPLDPREQRAFSEAAAPAPAALPTTRVTPHQPTDGKPDIPLWASAAAGDDGAIVLVPDPIDYLRRSERMLSVRNPFAFNVLGQSMSPAIDHGDQVVVNPSVVARTNMDCVFIHEGPEGMLALVKRYVRQGSDNWRVKQFNPAKEFDLSRKKWSRVHPIAEVRKAGVG